jgi:hypothetical protein
MEAAVKKLRIAGAFLLLGLSALAAPAASAAIPDSEGADIAPAPPVVSHESRAPRPVRTPRARAKRRRVPPAATESRRPETAASRDVAADRAEPRA